VTVTLLLFLPVLARLTSGGEQLTAYAGVIESLSARTVDVDALGALGEAGDAPLVVAENDRFVGVVTRDDVARALGGIQGLAHRHDPELVPEGSARGCATPSARARATPAASPGF
jgi:hypothetical protein